MKSICVIGTGISGLSISNLLTDEGYQVTAYESKDKPGGLIKCKIVEGAVYHEVGGHVFNTQIQEVKKWFNDKVNFEKEFIPSKRNAKILFKESIVNYPIENNIYQLDDATIDLIVNDLIGLKQSSVNNNYDEFLRNTFGDTLYELYFLPYNNKIWNIDLTLIPLEWLEGKLPMPKLKDILLSNFKRTSETKMVHSEFFYPKKNGSQHIVNSLAKGLKIKYNTKITEISKKQNKWIVNDKLFDHVIYTGDLRNLKEMLGLNIDNDSFKSNGTTNVFCEIEKSDTSWLYIPSNNIECHRIIYSGNFSPNNNGNFTNTCTIEYSGYKNLKDIKKDILKLPFKIKILDYNYEPLSYIIQTKHTKKILEKIKSNLVKENFHLLGRFAEWEYYNMDTAINASINLFNEKFKSK